MGQGLCSHPLICPPSVGKTTSRAASLQVEPDTVFSTKGRDRWAGLEGHSGRSQEARMSQENKSELVLLQVETFTTSLPPPPKSSPNPQGWAKA